MLHSCHAKSNRRWLVRCSAMPTLLGIITSKPETNPHSELQEIEPYKNNRIFE
jgi:hypothetical protein